MKDILDYGKGIRPPGAAVIKASSEFKSYTNRKTGTLYYLVDGLIKPNFDQYSWSPVVTDKNPWLEIRLPKAHELKKMVLYTLDGSLIDCDVVVNGKTFSLRDNRADMVTIPLNGEKSDLVRLNIRKRKPNGRLLTEVELY